MSSLTNVIIFTEGKRQTKVSTIEKKNPKSRVKIHLNNMSSCKKRCRLCQISMDMSFLTNVIIFTEGKNTKVSTIEKNIDASMNFQHRCFDEFSIYTFLYIIQNINNCVILFCDNWVCVTC